MLVGCSTRSLKMSLKIEVGTMETVDSVSSSIVIDWLLMIELTAIASFGRFTVHVVVSNMWTAAMSTLHSSLFSR